MHVVVMFRVRLMCKGTHYVSECLHKFVCVPSL